MSVRFVFPWILRSLKDRRIKYTAIGAIVLLVLFIFMAYSDSPVAERKWAEVQRGEFIIDILDSGQINSSNSVFIKSPMEWRMELQITDMVPEGTNVAKGDFLVKFDTSTLLEQLELQKDNLDQAIADLKRVEIEQFSRMSELESDLQMAVYSGEAAKMQLEQLKFESDIRKEEARLSYQKALLSYDGTEKQIEAQIINDAIEHRKATLNVEQTQTRIREIEGKIDELEIYSPISGMVVYQEIGGFGSPRHKVAVGDKPFPGQAVISIPDLSKIEFVALINEIDVAQVKPGQKAVLKLDAYEDTVFHGKVSNVAQLVEKKVEAWRWRRMMSTAQEPFDEVPTFQVSILLDGSDPKLKPGMTAQAKIFIEEIPDALYVPIGTVFENAEGSPIVFTRQSYPNQVPVETGKRNERFIIINTGVSEGNLVSWTSPDQNVHPIGWFAEMELRRTEQAELLVHIESMNEQGLTYDPQAKPTPVEEREVLSDGMQRSMERLPDGTSRPMERSRRDASPPMERPPVNIQDR
ncbi:HlyD family secretion protein [Candidatus Latescibacterota bacterium]